MDIFEGKKTNKTCQNLTFHLRNKAKTHLEEVVPRSKEDIRALWEKLDPSSGGEITAKSLMLGL